MNISSDKFIISIGIITLEIIITFVFVLKYAFTKICYIKFNEMNKENKINKKNLQFCYLLQQFWDTLLQPSLIKSFKKLKLQREKYCEA